MILGLLTVLLGPDRPKVLLLDDIEHGLHPLAQKQLVAVIGRIMEKFPDLQVIATAHSPYLLNYLLPEQVRIMAADAEGHALCGKLTDHPKFPTWKDEMAPGEMWSLFGEKWLAGVEAGS
jgi:predicted ATPase